jgi:DNA-binding transcriptional regulator of glucitol operon
MLAFVRALYTAVIYFGSFIVIGWLGKLALTRWMARHGATLSEVNDQFRGSAGKGRRFLLGFWRNED